MTNTEQTGENTKSSLLANENKSKGKILVFYMYLLTFKHINILLLLGICCA